MDKDSFNEYDAFIKHQCNDFGMDRNRVNIKTTLINLNDFL